MRNRAQLKATCAALALLATGLFAAPAIADIVHLDDVIIDGSLCVGFDCVNGESFGFDTIRMKENNTRLAFIDTSTSASFPSRDWRVVANDSTNGGANYLSFQDVSTGRYTFKVEADAPANALLVDNIGRIGISTANPVTDIHILSGNTPTVRLEQDGSSGFTPQTYDVASNEANFFIRDVTNGSALFFRAQPGAPSNSIYIASTGNIGLGTTSPDSDLHISDSGTPNIRYEDTAGNFEWEAGMASNDTFKISAVGTAGVQFRFTREGGLALQPQAAAPTVSLANGMIYYDSTAPGALCSRISGAWVVIGGGGTCS